MSSQVGLFLILQGFRALPKACRVLLLAIRRRPLVAFKVQARSPLSYSKLLLSTEPKPQARNRSRTIFPQRGLPSWPRNKNSSNLRTDKVKCLVTIKAFRNLGSRTSMLVTCNSRRVLLMAQLSNHLCLVKARPPSLLPRATSLRRSSSLFRVLL